MPAVSNKVRLPVSHGGTTRLIAVGRSFPLASIHARVADRLGLAVGSILGLKFRLPDNPHHLLDLETEADLEFLVESCDRIELDRRKTEQNNGRLRVFVETLVTVREAVLRMERPKVVSQAEALEAEKLATVSTVLSPCPSLGAPAEKRPDSCQEMEETLVRVSTMSAEKLPSSAPETEKNLSLPAKKGVGSGGGKGLRELMTTPPQSSESLVERQLRRWIKELDNLKATEAPNTTEPEAENSVSFGDNSSTGSEISSVETENCVGELAEGLDVIYKCAPSSTSLPLPPQHWLRGAKQRSRSPHSPHSPLPDLVPEQAVGPVPRPTNITHVIYDSRRRAVGYYAVPPGHMFENQDLVLKAI